MISRIYAVFIKEFVQLVRDRMSFGIMIGVPLMQLVLFGYAINTDPRHLPTAVLASPQDPYEAAIIAAARNTGYFDITHIARTERDLDLLIASGKVSFALQFPPHFSRDILAGKKPDMLIIADATDPVTAASAVSAAAQLPQRALKRDLHLGDDTGAPFGVIVHRRYNPAGDSHLNIVPGLLGVVLAMTMSMFTAMSITREIERGTWENLLSLPIKPYEVMAGKIFPYVLVGAAQAVIILVAAHVLFQVPLLGNPLTLAAALVLYIITNLAIGFTFSTIASNQMQAMQMSMFFILPNILLSGFAFPFLGMPHWAQLVGEGLPATHFIRIIRAVMLKGGSFAETQSSFVALIIISTATTLLALRRYRRTLD